MAAAPELDVALLAVHLAATLAVEINPAADLLLRRDLDKSIC